MLDDVKRERIFDLECFNAMERKDQNCLKSKIDFIWEEATAESKKNEIYFTPHGETHIFDLLYIFNNCFYLPMMKAVENNQLSQNQVLSSKELLFLLFSIMSHDVGMHLDVCGSDERERHAEYAYDWVTGKFFDNLSDEASRILGAEEGVDIIGKLCGAHSDYNGKPDYLEINRLDEEQTLNCGGQPIKIRTRLLAAILRFCDELDECEDRLGKPGRFKPDNNAPSDVWESYLDHWQICEFLKMPKVIENNEAGGSYCIKFDLNIGKIKCLTIDRNKENHNVKTSLSSLLRKLHKIFEKLDEKREKFFVIPLEGDSYSDEKSLATFFRGLVVKSFFDDKAADKEDSKEKSYFAWQKNYTDFIMKNNEELESFIKDAKNGHIISHKCLNYISEYKGHKSPCLHDYINMHKIFEPNLNILGLKELLLNTFGKIIDRITDNEEPDKSIIIGIDSIGSLLATIIGAEKSIPVLSYSSPFKKDTYPQVELGVDAIDKYKKAVEGKEHIFLISDVIYTFASMAKCLNDIGYLHRDNINIQKEASNKITVFCLFDRKPAEPTSDYFFDNSYFRINAYNQLSQSYKIYAIDEEKKTRFIKSSECIYCMLK